MDTELVAETVVPVVTGWRSHISMETHKTICEKESSGVGLLQRTEGDRTVVE
jgi:hypothetical protein